jgi:arylsulfatase A-like enzyme
LKKKTLIIFSSDNGGHESVGKVFNTSGPLRGYKRHLTEGGIRVPFLARWPGKIPSGKTSHEIIAFQDMMPTFAELAEFETPAHIDGVSVVDALLGDKVKNPHTFLYWDYGHCRSRYDQAVRMGKWKGIREGQGNKIQLYDLTSDIGETTDVSDTHPDIVLQIEEFMRAAVKPSPRYPIGKKYTGGPIWKKGR